jgi:hypothetical protein
MKQMTLTWPLDSKVEARDLFRILGEKLRGEYEILRRDQITEKNLRKIFRETLIRLKCTRLTVQLQDLSQWC